MTKPQTTTSEIAKVNGWKIAKDLTVAVAPTVIAVAVAVVITKKLSKD